ncbi:MAG: tRNA-dihydrouridine synthase family protein [Verrucomicrobiales bacterium]|nr:tRNA-dihydrouridine synthase family protein [Verrucomicrobiales bacterium]
MQDVTDLPFLRLIAARGNADLYFTEYFRVHASAQLERYVLRSITENPTGRPIIAQLIGNDPPSLARAARELQRYPIAGVDLNLGCPAPIVYRKCAGGGLLREPARIDAILGALRDAIPGRFTVKTRLGFDDPGALERLVPMFERHAIDLLTLHGRTVLEMYRPHVHLERIGAVVRALRCPVIANGGVDSPDRARHTLAITGARGLMIGRGAIRNPWLFAQILDHLEGRAPRQPTGHEVLHYVRELWDTTSPQGLIPRLQVQKMKKYLTFIAEGAEPSGRFLHDVRRVTSEEELFQVCRTWLEHDRPLALNAAPALAPSGPDPRDPPPTSP